MRVTVVSGKGGTGKSTFTANLAWMFYKNTDIVVVDADVDVPNLHTVLGVKKWHIVEEIIDDRVASIDLSECNFCGICSRHCFRECINCTDDECYVEWHLCDGCGVCDIVCPQSAVIFKSMCSGYLRVAKTGYGFYLVSAELVPGRSGSGKIVHMEKKRAEDIAEEVGANLILMDAAAGIGCQVIASISGSDFILYVVEPTWASFGDFKRALRLAGHFGVEGYVVVNKFDLDRDVSKHIVSFAEKAGVGFLGYIPYDKRTAGFYGAPLVEICPDSLFSRYFIGLFGRLIKVLGVL